MPKRQRLPKKRSPDWAICAEALFRIRIQVKELQPYALTLMKEIERERERTPGSKKLWASIGEIESILNSLRSVYNEAHVALKGINRG